MLAWLLRDTIFIFFQVLKTEKEKQEIQFQDQLTDLMEKQSREVQDLGEGTLNSIYLQITRRALSPGNI